jgi:membrane protein YqaA with SNARE-associated domain
MSAISIPAYASPLTGPNPLLLKEAKSLLTNPYMPFEAGFALNNEGMYHVAGHTYMKDVTGSMIDWWFGYVMNTEQYKQWYVSVVLGW